MALEQKLDDNTRREIARDWAYIAAVASNPNQKVSVGGKELPVTYAQIALEKLSDTATSVKEKGYLQAILSSASSDMQQHGTYTKPTQEALASLAKGYSYAIANSPVQEVAGLARELGYKEALPDFLLAYKGTFADIVRENAEKAKKKDGKAIAIMNAVQLIQEVIGIKAKDGLRDYLLGTNFSQLDAIYKNPELLKEAKEKAKKKANGAEAEESREPKANEAEAEEHED